MSTAPRIEAFTTPRPAGPIDLKGRVAIVTGAGSGLGRAHALALARRGARVVVNDAARDPAQAVADEIRAAGGEAMTLVASVTDEAAVRAGVETVMRDWQHIDVLVCNAGILRDRTFGKMALEQFREVLDVHLMGSVHFAHAVWPHMVAARYGRIVFTTSSSGLYGNFGQSNYGAAKLALVGLMQTLALEGERHGIRVNCLAPTAATAMTRGLLPDPMLDALTPESVSPAVVVLACEHAPTRMVLCAGAGHAAAANITLTGGTWIGDDDGAADRLLGSLDAVRARTGETVPASGSAQGQQEFASWQRNHAS